MDELELLRRSGTDIPVVDDGARSKVRRSLEETIEAELSVGSGPSSTTRPRRSRVLVGVSITALVLAVAIVQVLLPPGSGGPDPAGAALRRLSGVAALMRVPILEPGQYLYVSSSGVVGKTKTNIETQTTWSFAMRIHREVWSAADGSGRILEWFSDPRFASAEDRIAWRNAGSPALLPSKGQSDLRFDAGGLSPSDLAALPQDSAKLAAVISSGAVKIGGGFMLGDSLGAITALLGEVPASAELRSALFEATAHLPNIVWLGTVADPIGREGVGVAMVRSGVRTELIFDPQSSALLAVVIARVDASGAVTQMLESLSYATRGVVTSDHARPS